MYSHADQALIQNVEIRIRKGQTIMIPVVTVNRDEALWGEDAMKFRFVLSDVYWILSTDHRNQTRKMGGDS